MPRLQFPTAELVVEQGRTAQASAYLWLDSAEDLGARDSHTMFLILEPVESIPLAAQVADEVAMRLRNQINANRSQTATAALLTSLEMVNQWLTQANSLRPVDRRVRFGFTCVIGRGSEVYIAQAAPSQILIGQEGEVYAFPALESWRWSAEKDDQSEALPLGSAGDIQPDLYHTQIETGDLIVLCSTSLARVIEREPQDVFAGGDAGAAMAHLQMLTREYGVENAHGAAILVPDQGRQRRERELDFLRRVSDWCCHLLPEETADRIRRRHQNRDFLDEEVDLEPSEMHTLQYPVEVPNVDHFTDSAEWVDVSDNRTEFSRFEDQPEWRTAAGAGADSSVAADFDTDVWADEHDVWQPNPTESSDESEEDEWWDNAGQRRRRPLTELLAGAILALSAAVVGVWQLAINRDRPIGRPRDDGTLGIPRLGRYDHTVQMPDLTGVRRRLPRAPISRLTGLVAVMLVVILVAGLTISIRNGQQRERAARIESTLQAAMAQRQQAGQSSDPATSRAFLLAASQSVNEAEALGLQTERAAQERIAINADLDRVLKVERLANTQVLGGVPAAPAGVAPRLFFGNGQVYVFTDALYRLEANGTTLVRLIGSGDTVGASKTGTLQGAAWADGAPVVFDGSAAYTFDPTTASWSRQALGTFGSPYTGIVDVQTFSGNLYLLSPETAQILKFAAGSYSMQPEDWTAGVAADELAQAVDMEIDGKIYVLLADGRVVNFFRSAVESISTPEITPPITKASNLSIQPDRPYYYIADDQGRIIRFARDGRLVQQFMAASGAPALSNIQTMVVDDVLSTAYILTDAGLMTVRLPGPPR